MFSSEEFTVGTIADALPLSLVLPLRTNEDTVLIGQVDAASVVVILTGNYAFHSFLNAENQRKRGLIIPNVRIEVDEASVFDPDYNNPPPGSVIRSGSQLVVQTTAKELFGFTSVTLQTDLPTAGNVQAAFSRWQVVIADGLGKRVLAQVDVEQTTAP